MFTVCKYSRKKSDLNPFFISGNKVNILKGGGDYLFIFTSFSLLDTKD